MSFRPNDVEHHWIDSESFVRSEDYAELLEEYRNLEHGYGKNEKLYDRLKKLLPPEPEDKTATWNAMKNFKPDTIRSGAEAFFSCLDHELPRNDRELLDILYVFGKFMFKEMERQAEYWRRTATDALYLNTRPIYVDKEDVCLTPKK